MSLVSHFSPMTGARHRIGSVCRQWWEDLVWALREVVSAVTASQTGGEA